MKGHWLLFPLLLLLASGAQPGPVSLRLLANYWEPYTGAELPAQGLASELVVTALRRAGYEATVTIAPWPRVVATVYQGNADGVVAIWATNDRRKRLVLSDSYLTNDLYILYMPGALREVSNLSQLTGKRIGIGRDYQYSDNFLAQENFVVEPASRTLQGLLKLTVGRVDGVIEDKRVAQYQIQRNVDHHSNLGNIQFGPVPVMVLPLYLGISPKVPNAQKIIRDFNLEIKKMRKDGTLRAITERAENSAPSR